MVKFRKNTALKKHSRIKAKSTDQRTTALNLAGLELLADFDFENVSITRIAKAAKCSVGAFYYRYKDKNTYLRQLIAASFRGLENNLQNHFANLSSGKSTISFSEFFSQIIGKLSTPENTGIIRAALKLGATHPEALRAYEEYREYVAVTAENIFKSTSKKKISTREIREAIQIVFAAINDAALMPNSAAMELDNQETANKLCEFAASHIGVKPDFMGRIPKTTIFTGNSLDKAPELKNAEPPTKKKKPLKGTRGKRTLL